MSWNLKDRYRSYTEPWDPIRYGIWAIYVQSKEAFSSGRYRDLFSLKYILDSGFYLWFKVLNEHFCRFEQNQTAIPVLVPASTGVVLELGPGMGNQLHRFDRNKATRIVGVESNPQFTGDIETQIKQNGLEDIYELVTCRVEDSDVLEKHGVVAESVDTVLSIQVLCSVNNPEAVVKELYRLLKPGGKFIFWEHHRNSDWISAAIQYFWNPSWRTLIGGCNLTRDMRAIVAAAGEWENIDSIQGDEKPWGMLPRVWGELVKPAA